MRKLTITILISCCKKYKSDANHRNSVTADRVTSAGRTRTLPPRPPGAGGPPPSSTTRTSSSSSMYIYSMKMSSIGNSCQTKPALCRVNISSDIPSINTILYNTSSSSASMKQTSSGQSGSLMNISKMSSKTSSSRGHGLQHHDADIFYSSDSELGGGHKVTFRVTSSVVFKTGSLYGNRRISWYESR